MQVEIPNNDKKETKLNKDSVKKDDIKVEYKGLFAYLYHRSSISGSGNFE